MEETKTPPQVVGGMASFPCTEPFDEAPYVGTFQQVLAMNQHRLVRIDGVIGSSGVISHTGVVHEVGKQYVVIRMQDSECCVVIDIFSVKVITFLSQV